jgi:hypothetical protein
MRKVIQGLLPLARVRMGQYDRACQVGQYNEEGDRSPS